MIDQRAIVIFPAPEPSAADGWQSLADVRRRFDPLADRIAPHITLVFPFTSDLPPAALHAHIDAAIGDIRPFRLHLAWITGSEDEYLFLNVKRGNDTLIELHDRLYSGPLRPALSLAHTYTPHVTVGRLPNRDAYRSALAAAASTEITLDALAAALSVVRIEATGAMEVDDIVPLA